MLLGEDPPPYSPLTSPESGSAPVISCRVCQSLISVEGKIHQHVVKCGVCNEATVGSCRNLYYHMWHTVCLYTVWGYYTPMHKYLTSILFQRVDLHRLQEHFFLSYTSMSRDTDILVLFKGAFRQRDLSCTHCWVQGSHMLRAAEKKHCGAAQAIGNNGFLSAVLPLSHCI